jgi:hypothetical protein
MALVTLADVPGTFPLVSQTLSQPLSWKRQPWGPFLYMACLSTTRVPSCPSFLFVTLLSLVMNNG